MSIWVRKLAVPQWVLWIMAFDCLLALANVTTFTLRRGFGYSPTTIFRLSGESNVPTWWSSMQLMLIGLALAVVGYFAFDRQRIRTWAAWLPAMLFLFLSLDEVAMIHERIGHAVGPKSLRTGMWVPMLAPLFIIAVGIVAYAVWPLLRDKPAVIARFLAGFAVFLFSAVGLEMLGNLFADNSIGVHIEVILEETGEMIGGTILLWAAVSWAMADGVSMGSAKAPIMTRRKAASGDARTPRRRWAEEKAFSGD